MKRSKVVAAILACTILALSLFALAGCGSKSSKTSDGSGIVVSLSVKADSNETWNSSVNNAGIVEVSGPEATAKDKVEFTVTPAKDGTVDVTFTNVVDGKEGGSSATYSFEVKDGKISETGHSERMSGSF